MRDRDLWLWVAASLVAVGIGLIGVATALDVASKVPYSFWTSIPMIVAYVLFGLAVICFGCGVRGLAFPLARHDDPPSPPVSANVP